MLNTFEKGIYFYVEKIRQVYNATKQQKVI